MRPVLAIRRISLNTTQRDYGRDRQCGLVRGAAADPVLPPADAETAHRRRYFRTAPRGCAGKPSFISVSFTATTSATDTWSSDVAKMAPCF
jgi:hypothetical protein